MLDFEFIDFQFLHSTRLSPESHALSLSLSNVGGTNDDLDKLRCMVVN